MIENSKLLIALFPHSTVRARRSGALALLCALVLGTVLAACSSSGASGDGGAEGNSPFNCTGSLSSSAVGIAPTPDGQGYWIADSTGHVESCGDATSIANLSPAPASSIVGIAADPSAQGFWMAASDGAVYAMGQAANYGQATSYTLNKGIVSIAATPDGQGYWLLGGDGGVFTFGDAQFYGSTGSIVLDKPAVGMAATPDGKGYWFVASDGGIFSYGDASFYGSMGGIPLAQPVVGMAPSPDGKGYRMVASDGGIFTFGDASFYGSSAGMSPLPIVGMAPTHDGQGYWLVNSGGAVYAYGDATQASTTTTSGGTSSTTSSPASTSTSTTQATTTSTTEYTPPTTVPVDQITMSSSTDQDIGMPASSLNLTAIPMGGNQGANAISTTTPAVGSIYLCHTQQSSQVVTTPPWANLSNDTWNLTTKEADTGDVTWNSEFSATEQGNNLILQGNDLPPVSGTFPVTPADVSTDPAAEWNPDPTAITSFPFDMKVPFNPTMNSTPTCIGGQVGIAVNGVVILNGLDSDDNDAAAMETQDMCHGHPNPNSGYHYHTLSPCLLSATAKTQATQVGWAMDGFGIYVEYNSQGQLLTNADLDECHGRTSVVPWHGQMVDIYHYDMTMEYPYTVGCYWGTPATNDNNNSRTGPHRTGNEPNGPMQMGSAPMSGMAPGAKARKK